MQGEEIVRIEPKMMQVLLALAEQPGKTIARDTLLDQVWPEVVVTEDALSSTISKLRRALNDDAQAPRYIETIPKSGYRLIALVERVTPEPTSTPPPTPSLAQPSPPPKWLQGTVVIGVVLVLLVAFWLTRRNATPTPSVLRSLTTATGVERDPVLSPDGQQVAYAARARDAQHYDLYAQSLTDGVPLRLTSEVSDEVHPAWAPDGQSLAFLRCEELRCGVYTISTLGGAARRRAEASVAPYGLAWMPDGQHLITVDRADRETPYRLHHLDLDTGTQQPITDPPAGITGDLYPTLAPDGQILAFVRYEGGNQTLLRMHLPDGPPHRITTPEGRIRGLAWTPDGTLLIAATWEAAPGLWRVLADQETPERIAGPVLRSAGALAATGEALVVEDWTAEVNLWASEKTTDGWQPLRSLITSTATDWQPALSAEGMHIAFVSDRSGAPELWVARQDGSHLLRLTNLSGNSVGAPTWSPDGQRLAFEVHHEGKSNIYTMAAEGGQPQPLTDAHGYDHTPKFSQDGHWIYFGSDRSGDAQIWKVSTNGGALEQVTTAGGYTAAESLDGTRLYFTRPQEPGLWMRPLKGGPQEQVLQTLSPLDWGNWAITAAGLYYVDRTGQQPRLLQMNLDTKVVEPLFEVADMPSREVAFAATPDGRTVVFTQTERLESDLMLIEPLPR